MDSQRMLDTTATASENRPLGAPAGASRRRSLQKPRFLAAETKRGLRAASLRAGILPRQLNQSPL
jgi:hypothetical protein